MPRVPRQHLGSNLRVQHNQSAETITRTTAQIQQCDEQKFGLLHERALALARCVQYEAALLDAATMQSLAPTKALGYLCAGNIYAMQGNQVAAIREYDAGIERLSGHLEQRATLVAAKAEAEARLATRVDFISELYLETINNIVPRIWPEQCVFENKHYALDEPIPYLHVCKTWIERLLHAGGIPLYVDARIHRSPRAMERVVRLAPHVGALMIDCPKPLPNQFWHRAHFRTLQKLSLEDFVCYSEEQLVAALSRLGKTLTHLKMSRMDMRTPVQLGAILRACPRLVSLESDNLGLSLQTISQKQVLLKTLEIRNVDRPIESAVMRGMLDLLPSLETLAINNCIESEPLTWLHEYVPSLKKLTFGSQGFMVLRHTINPAVQGLQALFISSNPTYKQDDITALIVRHCNSLETLYFKGKLGGPRQLVKQHQDITFPGLTQFNLSLHDPEAVPFLVWLLERSPNLDEVHLGMMRMDPRIMDAVTKLRKLRSMIMVAIQPRQSDSLRQLFEHHGALGARSSLEELNLGFYGVNKHLLSAIAKLSNLKALYMGVSEGRMDASLAPIIKDMAGHCTKLERLTIDCESKIDDSLLLQMHLFKNLKHLELNGHGSHKDRSVLSLLDCQHLEHLQVSTEGLSEETCTLLKNRFPRISIY